MADAPTPTVEYASAGARLTLVGHFLQLRNPAFSLIPLLLIRRVKKRITLTGFGGSPGVSLQARRGETLGVIAAIRAHCNRAVWLEGGRVRAVGPAPEVVALYEGRTEG